MSLTPIIGVTPILAFRPRLWSWASVACAA